MGPATSAWVARIVPAVGPVVIAATAVAMLAWTWRTWPDPIVDYGREVYAAWQIASGKTLYVDVAHLFGPLSVYVNALCFRLFGPSILGLALWNGALTAAFVVVLYGMLVRMASRLAATVACVVFVTMFGVSQFTRIGNYNWLCPYAHELPHGAMLAILALWCLDRYHRTRSLAWTAAAGLALGLLALTKTEPLSAGLAGFAVGIVLVLVAERPDARRIAVVLATVAGAALVPLVAALAFFSTAMPFDEVLRWPLGHWALAARNEFASSGFYQGGMGMDDVPRNAGKIATGFAAYVVVLGLAVGGAALVRHTRRPHAIVAGVGVASALVFGRLVSIDGWFDAIRPLPLLMAIAAGVSLVEFWRHRADAEAAGVFALRTSFAVLALALLAKMVLNARVFHYGFVLAMPATMLLVIGLVEWLPAEIDRRGWSGSVVRAVAVGAILAMIVSHVRFMDRYLAGKVYPVGEGGDRLYADRRGVWVAELVKEIRARTTPEETLLAMPESVMINYLARIRNPTRYFIFDRTSRILWSEEAMERDMMAAAPDTIVLLDRGNMSGGSRIGVDYLQRSFAWIQSHYQPLRQFGARPFHDQRGGAILMRRRPE